MLVTKTDISQRLREEVDRRAGEHDGRHAEAERQQRRGQRAEDGEQDDEDDREAGELGLLEVLLGDVLHARPQRLLADEVDGQRQVAVVLDVQVLAQVDRRVDRGVGAAGDARATCSTIGWSPAALAAAAACGSHADVRDPLDLPAWPCRPTAASAAASFLRVVEDEDQRLGLHAGEALERLGDGLGARAGHLEAAGGEVLGLLRGERHRGDDKHDPNAQNESPTTRDESLEPIHGCPHGCK